MTTKKLDVAIAAGGTAGHINPALALAEELVSRGHHVTFYGQPNRLEATLVPEAGFDFCALHISGFDRSRPWTLITSVARTRKAMRVVEGRFDEEGMPDVAIGFGAYVELPLLDAAAARGIPVVLHEQNSVPGLANKTEAKKASVVCVSLPVAAEVFEGGHAKVVLTGNPVRSSVIESDARAGRASVGANESQTLLLVFGGSLGARHVNQGVIALKEQILSRPDVFVVHSTGKGEFDSVVEKLALSEEEGRRWKVLPYISNMGDLLAAADLVLSRAGASSVAEIAALAVPSLLVPYPFATADHQTTNAHYLVDAGAARLVRDDDIDESVFSETLFELLDNPKERQAMREAARGLGQAKAASTLADQVESAAEANKREPIG